MRIGKLFVGALVCLATARLAEARTVTVNFSGTVGAITDTSAPPKYVPSDIHSGVPYVGTFSYNDSVSDTGSPGVYRGTALDLQATVTIAGTYTYTLTTPTTGDEIDLVGNMFEFFKRGPTVTESFAPDPPFSHFEFLGDMTASTTSLPAIQLAGGNADSGVSDQQTANAPYYYIGSSVSTVPEPAILPLFAAAGLLRRRRR